MSDTNEKRQDATPTEEPALPPMPDRKAVMGCAEYFVSPAPLGELWDVVNALHAREKARST